MEARELKMIFRFSILLSAIVALFWVIWYQVVGSVPSVSEVQVLVPRVLRVSYHLPFSTSRAWDVLIGPIGATLLISIVFSKTVRGSDDGGAVNLALVVALAFGIARLIIGWEYGLIHDLSYVLAAGMVIGLIIGLTGGFMPSLVLGSIISLASGMIVGIGFGWIYGVTHVLAFCLATILGAALTRGIIAILAIILNLAFGVVKTLLSGSFYRDAVNWLLVKSPQPA